MDDNDSSIHDTIPSGDHHALAIMDRWAHALETILTKIFLEIGNTNWTSSLESTVNNYKNSHTKFSPKG